ncbi:MAG: hypothetical protein VX785_06370 [Actinomycetota bacterium]|nr:hypothetical protein [Acidimicrobiales bacterium]MED5552312.1 hypothetical protein [Actinomycetota bacterium]
MASSTTEHLNADGSWHTEAVAASPNRDLETIDYYRTFSRAR